MAFTRRLKITLALAAAALLGAAGTAAYLVWRISHGTESLHGPHGPIPPAASAPGPLEPGKSDWPRWRGPRGDGKTDSPVGTGGLRKLWEVNYLCQGPSSVTWSAPAIQGNRLVVPGRDGDRDLVFGLDPVSGRLLWIGSYEAPAGSGHGAGPRATPFIDGDRAYTFGRGGHLACWDLMDGRLIWITNVADAGGREPDWGHSSSPLVLGDKVFVQGGGSALVAAYDKTTGRLAWKHGEGKAGYAALAAMNHPRGPLLLAFHATGLLFLSPQDGRRVAEFPWETRYDVNATTPAVEGTTVFITSGYQTGGAAVALGEDATPSLLWRSKAIASHHSDPILLDGHVYGYSGQSTQNRGALKCLELRTGRECWSTDQAGWGTMILAGGLLACLDIRGNLRLVKPDPAAFRKVAEYPSLLGPLKDPAWTPPAAANGRLYLRHMQRLLCLGPAG